MFSAYAKTLLILTAMAPVALVYAWVLGAEGNWLWCAILVIVALVLWAVCNDLLLHADRKLERMEFRPASVEAADRENIAFLLLYLSPVFTSQFGSLNVSVLIPTLVIFAVMSATGYNYHFNPLMGFLGWHFYRVTSSDSVTYVLVTKKQLRRSGEVAKVGQLTEYILIELEDRNAGKSSGGLQGK